MRIVFEPDPGDQKKDSSEGPQSRGPQDVWRFGEIRTTLWGKEPFTKSNRNIWDFSRIRKTLWGK